MKKEILTATTVAADDRLSFFPEMFGVRSMGRGESLLYTLARKMASEHYVGGTWVFHRISNGGCYASPSMPERLTICILGNQFERELSRDAAGLVISLFVLGALLETASTDEEMELLSGRYEQLGDFVSQHPEREAIRSAIS